MPSLLELPPELHLLIIAFLPPEDQLQVRLTSTWFYRIVPAPSHRALLQIETGTWARHLDLYTCRYCLRLRPACRFGQGMLRRRRSRAGRDSHLRFCVECGLNPRQGMARYGPGAHIMLNDRFYVVCLICRTFQPGATDRHGRHTSQCVNCWQQTRLD